MANRDQSRTTIQRNSRASSKPDHKLRNNKPLSSSPKGVPLHLQIGRAGGFCSAPDSSMSSPRSPMRALGLEQMRAFGSEQMLNSGLWTGKPYPDIASGHCYSPVSGHNSSNNSVGGDPSAFRATNKCSAECSPIPSPRMTSPGPSSRIQSSNVSPLHPKAGGAAAELPTRRPDVNKQQSHRLPLPPIKVTKPCPFSPTYSVSSTPSAPRSPARPENSTSPGSRWTKGHLLGRGTFGHVYLGFSRFVLSVFQKQIAFKFASVHVLFFICYVNSGPDSKLIFDVFQILSFIHIFFKILHYSFNFKLGLVQLVIFVEKVARCVQ